jgi:hypothetical protein
MPQNQREVFGATTTMMMMPLMLMREQTWSQSISIAMRGYSLLPTLSKLLEGGVRRNPKVLRRVPRISIKRRVCGMQTYFIFLSRNSLLLDSGKRMSVRK